MESTERILEDLYYTIEQKLKRVVSLLRDEAYCWWQFVVRGTQVEHLTWDICRRPFRRNV